MSPTNYHWWSRECQQEDPIFGTGQAERGQKFIPLDQLEDEGYTFIFADHAWSLKLVCFRRYVPDIDDSSALRTYPVCEKTGKLIPFVYTHHQMVCSKNGTSPTFVTSKSSLIRKPLQTQFGSCHGCITLGREADCDLQVGVRSCIGALAGKLVFGPQGQYRTIAEALTAIESGSISLEVGPRPLQYPLASPTPEVTYRYRSFSADRKNEEEEKEEAADQANEDEEREGQASEQNEVTVSGAIEGREDEERTSKKRRVDAPATGGVTEERPRKKTKDSDGLAAEMKAKVSYLVTLMIREELKERIAELENEPQVKTVSRD